VIKELAERILKYRDFTTEIQRMWNVKTKVIPVIIGATGIVSKSFRKHLNKITKNATTRYYRKQPHWAMSTYFGKY
jgi:adenine-specific DNA methylase